MATENAAITTNAKMVLHFTVADDSIELSYRQESRGKSGYTQSSLEFVQPLGNVAGGVFKILSEGPHTANDVFPR